MPKKRKEATHNLVGRASLRALIPNCHPGCRGSQWSPPQFITTRLCSFAAPRFCCAFSWQRMIPQIESLGEPGFFHKIAPSFVDF